MQAIGYKEVALYLNCDIPFDEAVRIIKKRSKNYAKRQFTWFRQEKDIHWLDVSGLLSSEKVHEAIEIFLGNRLT